MMTVCPTVPVIDPLMIYARVAAPTPSTIVGMYVASRSENTSVVGSPFIVTVCPVFAVDEPDVRYAAIVVPTLLMVVGSRVRTIPGTERTIGWPL